ncbi:hypothetical protein ACIPSE_44980 [Streptomyces sp. NPDC090106]|uniref:hypothetical protein n=1 Tax=Streptomyces sp. NPDC090106 TaxID=3365946 RepID=UPI00382F6BEF
MVELSATELLEGYGRAAAKHAEWALEATGLLTQRGLPAAAFALRSPGELHQRKYPCADRLLQRAAQLTDALTDAEMRDNLDVLAPLSWASRRWAATSRPCATSTAGCGSPGCTAAVTSSPSCT